MYDSSICVDWKVMVTFQQLIVLADDHGIVDMTPQSIHRRTGIPLDIIQYGLEELEKPDPDSRSPDCEGARIEKLDGHRSWGWSLVNYDKYKMIQSREDRRDYQREYMRKYRETKGGKQPVNKRKQVLAQLGHIDTDTNTDTNININTNKDKKTGGLSLFDSFWKAYPKKKSKGQAEKAFKATKASKQLLDKMLSTIERAKTSLSWQKESGKFIPYPATWLNAKGWEDEVEVELPKEKFEYAF